MNPKIIQFIRYGSFSHINMNIRDILNTNFKGYQVEELDLLKIVKRKKFLIFFNILFTLFEFSRDFLKQDKKVKNLKTYFDQTSYYFRQLTKIIRRCQANKTFSFTIQTQCLFDAHIEGTTHFIYTDHTNLENLNYPNVNSKQYLSSKRFHKLEKSAYKNCSLIFTMSSNVSRSLITQYGIEEDKVVCIKAGSNIPDTFEITDKDYSLKKILFVGLEWERKGGPLIIEAFKRVIEIIPDATLDIIGCSPDVHIKNCNVLGKMPVEKIASYYKRATIFCLPAKREPFGIVFIEAMRYKLPIVTNDIGATIDFVKNDFNGYRINDNPDEYVKKLVYLLKNPDICQLFGNNSYNIARDNYSWEKVGERLRDNVFNVLGE